jgi:hypothetical protein
MIYQLEHMALFKWMEYGMVDTSRVLEYFPFPHLLHGKEV